MVITGAYTEMRWSKVAGLAPEFVRDDALSIDWKP
jgi:hypothetical protein